jgi:hypothetical protein
MPEVESHETRRRRARRARSRGDRLGRVEVRRRRPVAARHQYLGKMPVEKGEGRPSRWNTLRALRVLSWYSARD